MKVAAVSAQPGKTNQGKLVDCYRVVGAVVPRIDGEAIISCDEIFRKTLKACHLDAPVMAAIKPVLKMESFRVRGKPLPSAWGVFAIGSDVEEVMLFKHGQGT